MNKQENPLKLKLVAISFLVIGVWCLIRMLHTIITSNFNIDFGILGVFICFGLLNHKKAWYNIALVWIWLEFIIAPIAVITLIFHKNLSRIIEYEGYPETVYMIDQQQ